MSELSALASAVNGMQTSMQGVRRVAGDVARLNITAPGRPSDAAGQAPGPQTGDGLATIAGSMVDLKIYSRQFEANVRVVDVVDEMLGALLDERA